MTAIPTAGVAAMLVALFGGGCSGPVQEQAPTAPREGRDPSKIASGSNMDGRCRWDDRSLQCCGTNQLDDLRVVGVNGVWLGLSILCYTLADGGGRCVGPPFFGRHDIPSRMRVSVAVAAERGICVLTEAGSVECVTHGQWRQVMEHADGLEASANYVFILAGGDISCLGRGLLGCGAELPKALTHVGDIVAMQTSLDGHVCGLREGGAVICWGGIGNRGYGVPSRPVDYLSAPTYITDIAPITWLRRVGRRAFCGGSGTASDTLQCWGPGPAPVIGLAHNETLRQQPEVAFPGGAVRFDRPIVDVTGSVAIGCFVEENGIETCVTTDEVIRDRCGATLLPTPSDL